MPDQPIVEESVDQSLKVAHSTAVESIDRALRGDTTVLAELAVEYVVPASLSLVAVFIGYLAAKYLARVISGPICKRVDETLGKFVGRVVFYGTLLSVVAMVLSLVGIRMGGVATVLAATGFAVGLAFQGTLSNFAAGVLLLVFRPFKVGDVINAAGMMGKVNEIDLFTTTLDTPDNRRIIVPNSSISGGTIENVSYHKQRRVEVIVGVAYAASLDETRSALTTAAESLANQMIGGEGRGFAVVLATLADSSVQWKVRVWVSASDYWAATEQLTAAVKRELDAVGVSIAFPQLEVHLHRANANREAPSADRTRPRLRVNARVIHQQAS